MYVHTKTLTRKLATTNTHNILTTHANTTAQIPKMAKLLTQMEHHHSASGGDNMNIDYILRASHKTLLTWPIPTNPTTTPSTPTNPSSPHISYTLAHPHTPTLPYQNHHLPFRLYRLYECKLCNFLIYHQHL